MSCEELLQAICRVGHLYEDGYFDPVLPAKCPHCKEPWIWTRTFDVTNGGPPDGEGAIVTQPAIARPPTELDKPPTIPEISPCGCSRVKVESGFCDVYRPDGRKRDT